MCNEGNQAPSGDSHTHRTLLLHLILRLLWTRLPTLSARRKFTDFAVLRHHHLRMLIFETKVLRCLVYIYTTSAAMKLLLSLTCRAHPPWQLLRMILGHVPWTRLSTLRARGILADSAELRHKHLLIFIFETEVLRCFSLASPHTRQRCCRPLHTGQVQVGMFSTW